MDGGGSALAASGVLWLNDELVPPILYVIVCALRHELLLDGRPLRAHLLHVFQQSDIFVDRPVALV
jgi:hypothetical protein